MQSSEADFTHYAGIDACDRINTNFPPTHRPMDLPILAIVNQLPKASNLYAADPDISFNACHLVG